MKKGIVFLAIVVFGVTLAMPVWGAQQQQQAPATQQQMPKPKLKADLRIDGIKALECTEHTEVDYTKWFYVNTISVTVSNAGPDSTGAVVWVKYIRLQDGNAIWESKNIPSLAPGTTVQNLVVHSGGHDAKYGITVEINPPPHTSPAVSDPNPANNNRFVTSCSELGH